MKGSVAYNGNGSWSETDQPIQLASPYVSATPAPIQKIAKIENNRQLSYARAYEGITYLKKQIDKKFQDKGIITFAYEGRGQDNGQASFWQQRRIEFHINPQE